VEEHAERLLGFLEAHRMPVSAEGVFTQLAKAALVVPGFAIEPRTVMGNFSYAKLAMV